MNTSKPQQNRHHHHHHVVITSAHSDDDDEDDERNSLEGHGGESDFDDDQLPRPERPNSRLSLRNNDDRMQHTTTIECVNFVDHIINKLNSQIEIQRMMIIVFLMNNNTQQQQQQQPSSLINQNNKFVQQPIKNFHNHHQIVLDQVVEINQQQIDLNLVQNQVQLNRFQHLI